MPLPYTKEVLDERPEIAFIDNGTHKNSDILRLRQNISHAPPAPPLMRLRSDWEEHKPYYIILFIVSFVIVLGFGLFIYSSLTTP
jgi:hypothetical protein